MSAKRLKRDDTLKVLDLVKMAANDEDLPYAIKVKCDYGFTEFAEFHYDHTRRDFVDIRNWSWVWGCLFRRYGTFNRALLNAEVVVLQVHKYDP